MYDVNAICTLQQKHFATGATRNVAARILTLKKLYSIFKEHEKPILSAISNDTGKTSYESYITEFGLVLHELSYIIKNLQKWTKPTRLPTPLALWPGKSSACLVPLGTVLIISPWNYPFLLTASPLIGSMAAGNCNILKMSSKAPATSEIMREILAKNFEPELMTPLSSNVRDNALFSGSFNHIFFTGSNATGKAIMARASETLTPVTLELGGKSPCLITSNAHIDSAARRIVWGKLLNSGQTCVAPDYVLVPQELQEQFIERIKFWNAKLYPPSDSSSAKFYKIISPSALGRFKAYLQEGDVALGGEVCDKSMSMQFTVLTNIKDNSHVMQDEIFGPVLPVIAYKTLDDAVQKILNLPAPLSLYLFTQSEETEAQIMAKIPCGGCCVNDTVVHLASPYLPFGGTGQSGMGVYHGKWSIENFSHKMAIFKRKGNFDLPLRLPPITGIKEKIAKFLLSSF